MTPDNNQQAARELEERDRDSHEWTLRNNGYEEIADLLAMLRSQAREWLPIESAPKDGTEILAYSPEPYAGIFRTAWRPMDCDGWGCIDSCCGYYVDLKPTHWQPLPAPPRPTQERSDEG